MRRSTAIASALALALAGGCVALDPAGAGLPADDSEDGDDYVPYDSADRADSFEPPAGPLVFEGACEPGDHITIAAVGDVLLHAALQRQAFSQPDRYISLWREARDLLAQADLAYANLEGPTAAGVNSSGRAVADPGEVYDGVVYTSYPMFNYHPSLVDDLLATGIDVVSTANNHSLDRRALGADRTLDALDAAGLPHTGTRRSGTTEPWHAVTEAGGFRLAWLSCTYGTNGIPDSADQVLHCYEDDLEGLVSSLARRPDLDAVIVTPHFGEEYQASPNDSQVRLAHRLLDAGALVVLGSHPHVLQPWERYVTADGRETFVIYSLGNFVSGQNHLPRRSTLLLYLGLTRTASGRVVVNGARYVPLHMSRRSPGLTLDVIDRSGGLEDSRALTVSMFKPWNVFPPEAPLLTNPQCDPSWQPPPSPHAHDGWIGGSCAGSSSCGGASCEDALPGGFCTEPCAGTCPDRAGRATTFCVDLGLGDEGSCVLRCGSSAECRPGYRCAPVARYGEPGTVRTACVPAA